MLRKSLSLLLISLVYLLSSPVFSQAPPPSDNVVTLHNCGNTNGITRSAEKGRRGNVPGMDPDTRLGNNGKGNGGESFNTVINLYSNSYLQTTDVYCISTESEDVGGKLEVYLDGNLVFVGSTRELDPTFDWRSN